MKLVEYLHDKLFAIISFIISILLVSIFLWIIETRILFIFLLDMILISLFILPMIFDFIKRKRYYNNLLELLIELDEKALLSEIGEKPEFKEGEIISTIISETDKYMNDSIANISVDMEEYRDYIEIWVHEIKTPITSANLIIENNKDITNLKILDEINKIDKFVEQALFYARSTSLEKDFKITNTSLKDLVNESIKSYSKLLIQSKGKLKFNNLDIRVDIDKKFCVFILGQLIANAIKYKRDDLVLEFTGESLENSTLLKIRDNGLGISKDELPRIFDKGFTGKNYSLTKSTGIGLYLAKKLSTKMNIKISVDSVLNSYTEITLEFPKESLFFRAE